MNDPLKHCRVLGKTVGEQFYQHMYSKIMVPLDGSELANQVLPHVRLLGKAFQASIELLRVIEPIPPDLLALLNGLSPEQVIATRIESARADLDRAAILLRQDGLNVSITVLEGDSSYRIVSEGDRGQDTLVAMSTHGRSGRARWTLSSVTDKVLHSTNNPLLIITPKEGQTTTAEAKLERIIVPLDGSRLAEQVLPYVASLAGTLGLTVALVRVTPSTEDYNELWESTPAGGRASFHTGTYQEFSGEANERATEYLQRIKDGLAGGLSSVELRILNGHPALAIVGYANETQNNLIAMTTNGHSGLGHWGTGSVADRVSGCGNPVLLVRATSEI